MTINSIGTGPHYFSNPGIALDAEGQLALLLLNKEETQQESQQDSMALARSRFVTSSNEQVEAMHDEADAITRGAFFQAAAGVTAAGIQLGDAAMEPACNPLTGKPGTEKPWGELAAGAAQGLSEPLGKWLGDAPAADARADAKRAGTTAQQAEWQLSDAKQAVRDSDEQQNKITDWLSSEASSEHSAQQAIIAGLA